MASIYDFNVTDISGQAFDLHSLQHKVLLIVNTASQCGFTPQYAGLEVLYQQYKDKGLEILGFPCNQFGGQEPGREAEILDFCTQNFNVSFPLFSKVDVNGANAHPLFEYLKNEARGIFGTRKIKWNFTKFLVDRDGKVVKRFAPKDKPLELYGKIAELL